MRQDKYKIKKGDIFFKPSKSYNRVFEIEILDIWLEDYVSGYKTIVLGKYEFGKKEFFASDIIHCYDTYEEAEKALSKGD